VTRSPLPSRGVARGLLGLAVGLLLLWLALRDADPEALASLARRVRPEWIALALALYAVDLLARMVRWHLLLRQLAPGVAPRAVGETLLVGYAVNNLLPARLGELFRADYARRVLGVPRMAALGSIVVERGLDALIVVACLAAGLLALAAARAGGAGGGDAGEELAASLGWIAAVGGLGLAGLVALLAGGSLLARRAHGWTRLPEAVLRRLRDLGSGLATLRGPGGPAAVLLSPALWAIEAAALWCVVRAVGVALGLVETLVLVGAVSLSTLVPTAPGYVGSYQFVFALVLAGFGHAHAAGIVAATLVQVFLFGAVTVAGLTAYLARNVHGLWVRQDG
jgi:glycosyltransferase 2 family protein